MLTSKQRAKLRSIAQKLEPVTQVGKAGVTEKFLDNLNNAIEKREIVKVTVLGNSSEEVKAVGEAIARLLPAEFVCATGKKIVFYRRSLNDKIEHIEF